MEFSEDTIVELQDLLDQANDGDDLALANLLSRFQSRFYVLVRKMLWRYPHLSEFAIGNFIGDNPDCLIYTD